MIIKPITIAEKKGRESSQEQAFVTSLAKDLVTRLAMLLKTARMHSVNNAALQYSVKIFCEASNDLLKHLGEFAVRGDRDSIFLNEYRVRPEPILYDNIIGLMGELARRGTGGLNITGIVGPAAVRSLVQVLLDNERLDEKSGAETLNEALARRGVATIRFLPRLSLVTDLQQLEEVTTTTEAVQEAVKSVNAYTNLLVTWKAYLASEETLVSEAIRGRIVHAIQAAVDVLLRDPQWFLAAAMCEAPETYRVVHSVNMTCLALSIGRQLELGRRGLMNLGLATLFADSGMRREPPDKLPSSAPGHPLESVKEILQGPNLGPTFRDRIVTAYEHHIARDGSGFPDPLPGKGQHTFAAITAIVDAYDEYTSDLPGRPAMSPSRALEVLSQEDGRFEPRLVRIFIHILGPFPIGTPVLLSTGEMADVCRPALWAKAEAPT
jgi:HD-GYP domain-containing protein (c-di-GMP phosphodiesterase class II)